jgi:hypothetical protein
LLTDSEFFLGWLPTQLAQLDLKQRVPRTLSLQVEVGPERYRIELEPSGAVRVESKDDPNPTFRLRLDRASFERLLAPVSEAVAPKALRVPTLDTETLDLVVAAAGCLEATFEENGKSYQITFGPGNRDDVGCRIHCDLADFERVRAGTAQPFELLMNGKLRIEGDPQIALALGSLLM